MKTNNSKLKRESPTNGKEKSSKSAKKAKLTNGVAAKKAEESISAETEAQTAKASLKSVDASIFIHFKELTNEDEKKRIDAALPLLLQLSKTKDPARREKEIAYALKRLVRGCGAATNASRAGFFTALVALLKAFPKEELTTAQIFETMEKELHVGASIGNKEDADAIVGRILTCGAFMHAERLAGVTAEHLQRLTNFLLLATRHRSYHASLGYSFLIELLEQLTEEQFSTSVWPLLQKDLCRPWPKQTLQTVHCLMAAQRKFPSLLNEQFLQSHLGCSELLCPESFKTLFKIFWDHSNTSILTHPAFELFGVAIAGSAHLSAFWSQAVEPALESPTKLLELETLKMATDILQNLDTTRTKPVELLGRNFMAMLVEGLKNLKQKKDETLKAFYNEFFEALLSCCSQKTLPDTERTTVIRRLLLPPVGVFNIEKFTSTRIVHQIINLLGEAGVKDIYVLYKDIFRGALPKNVENKGENWLHFERLNAGFMLQHLLAHKSVQASMQWRAEQLRFLLQCGLFYVSDDAASVCKKNAIGSFSKDFGEQCKNMFFTSLQGKLTDLAMDRELLFKLAEFLNESLVQKNTAKCLRLANFDESLRKSWQSMFEAVSTVGQTPGKGKKSKKAKSQDSGDQLQLIFHILLLNMGFQLFREPEMAAPAIDDLLKCMQRTQEKRDRKTTPAKIGDSGEAEPEWIEVVVDLFLHLLSQNMSALRNVVNALFPHLCPNLNLSAVHQILAVLDMKDGNNPLSGRGEKDEEGEEEDENEAPEANDDEASEAEDEKEIADEASDAEDDSEESEESEEEEEEDVTATDKLRNAISQALMDTGAAPARPDDDDAVSVDLNDLTEEEGRKLDEALANAFKAIRKTNGGASQSKKSKSYRAKTTTVMHFRIRVLDLVDIYLQHQPTLLISIEIMLALFDMLEFCVGPELRPLQAIVEKVLHKLTGNKSYALDDDLKEENLVSFLRLIMEKRIPAAAYELTSNLRNKCAVFLIASSAKLPQSDGSGGQVLDLCREYAEEFVQSRNPLANISLLTDIFRLRWLGVWSLALSLAEWGTKDETRTFRRIQILSVLSVLYRNNELHKMDEKRTAKTLKKIEKLLAEYVLRVGGTEGVRHSLKEFDTLLELLLNVKRLSGRLKYSSILCAADVNEAVQSLRRRLRLESTQTYQRYCGVFQLKIIRNNELAAAAESATNGHAEVTSDAEDAAAERKQSKGVGSGSEVVQKAKKHPSSLKELHQQKKLKRQQRIEAASKGLNGGIPFLHSTRETIASGVGGEDESGSDGT